MIALDTWLGFCATEALLYQFQPEPEP